MARKLTATARSWTHNGPGFFRDRAPFLWRGACALLVLCTVTSATAQSNKVNITKLNDANFGMLANLGVDAVNSQSVCAYSATATGGYRVTATGSGNGNAFTLASGLSTMAYDVQWNGSPGQTSGFQLTTGSPLTGLVSSARHQTCNSGPTTSASLIVILRSAASSSATAGSYAGTLTLLIGPE